MDMTVLYVVMAVLYMVMTVLYVVLTVLYMVLAVLYVPNSLDYGGSRTSPSPSSTAALVRPINPKPFWS